MHNLWSIAPGMLTTVQYTLLTLLGSVTVGLLVAHLRASRYPVVARAAMLYISFFRGTPSLLHLSMVYYGIPPLLGWQISPLVAGVVAFSVHSGAYTAEILRAGIQSVDKGQLQVCRTLGIGPRLAFWDIVLPQALRNAFPALTGEAVNILKDTALVSIIGEADIMRRAQLVSAESYAYFGPLMLAAGCYYVLALGLQAAAHWVEKRIDYTHC